MRRGRNRRNGSNADIFRHRQTVFSPQSQSRVENWSRGCDTLRHARPIGYTTEVSPIAKTCTAWHTPGKEKADGNHDEQAVRYKTQQGTSWSKSDLLSTIIPFTTVKRAQLIWSLSPFHPAVAQTARPGENNIWPASHHTYVLLGPPLENLLCWPRVVSCLWGRLPPRRLYRF